MSHPAPSAQSAGSADSANSALSALSARHLVAWIDRANELICAQADYLTELDAAIGDADHGANMKRGLAATVQALDQTEPTSPAAVLKTAAMTLISKVGGASGPLYGTFFLRMSTCAGQAEVLDLPALTAAVEAGVAGIAQRGRSQAGEKTMLDAWYPALEALSAGTDLAGATSAAAGAAESGRDATEPMIATKGRASYLVERSIGHIDPGAASTALVVRALADVVKEAR